MYIEPFAAIANRAARYVLAQPALLGPEAGSFNKEAGREILHDSLWPDARDFSRERKAVPIPNLFIIIDLSPQYNDANSYG